MRQRLIPVMGSLAFLLGIFGASSQVAAVPVTTCDVVTGQFLVNNAADAALVGANGYSNAACDLIITVDVPVTIQNLSLTSKTLRVESANPPDPTQRTEIINDVNSLSTITILTSGNVVFNGATVMAHKTLSVKCTSAVPPPGCTIESDHSDIVAASSFTPPFGSGGVLSLRAIGPIDIQTTNLHGGDEMSLDSQKASITVICGGGLIPCKDPNVAPVPKIIADQCPPQPGDPPGTLIHFPCNPLFQNAAELREVCIGQEAVQCNGGHKEKRFTAETFIDITGSTIVSNDHITFTCGTDLFGVGATLNSPDKIAIRCQGKVDIKGADITADLGLSVTSGSRCPRAPNPAAIPPDPGATEPCIDAHGATLTAKPLVLTANNGVSQIDACQAIFTVSGATSFPSLNKKPTPATYPVATVFFNADPAPQCGPGNEAQFLH